MLERDGFETDTLMSMPPIWVEKGGTVKHMGLATLPGTGKNEGKDAPREHVVGKTSMKPQLVVALDGATTYALTGETFGDMFSNTEKDDMDMLLRVLPLGKMRSLQDLAEELVPGCTADGSSQSSRVRACTTDGLDTNKAGFWFRRNFRHSCSYR